MSLFKHESFYIEIKDELFHIYRNNEEIYLIKYIENSITEEKSLINNCKYLNTVILSSSNKISIIITTKESELILYTLFNEEITNKITLINSLQNAKCIEIASVYNSLNIFYINNNTLYFRILNNKLILSPPLILDIIDIHSDPPFIIATGNTELSICYIKSGSPNLIGYREFDFKKNSWSNFNLLDSSYYLMKDYSFITVKDSIFYSFIFSKGDASVIRFGFGSKYNIKRDLIKENSNILSLNTVLLNTENKVNILYILDNVLKLKEIDLNCNSEHVIEIDILNTDNIKKSSFQSNNNIYTNFIFVIESENKTIYTDSYFFSKHLDKTTKNKIEFDTQLNNNLMINEINNYDKTSSKGIHLDLIQENMIKELSMKLKKYEEKLYLISINNAKNDERKNNLRSNIASLHQEITKKYDRITTLEKALTEKQNLINSYENKLKDLMNSEEALQAKELELEKKEAEILELRTLITEKDIENSNHLNEFKNLKEEIANLNNLIQDKTEEIDNIKNEQLILLQEKNKESFIKKIFKTGY